MGTSTVAILKGSDYALVGNITSLLITYFKHIIKKKQNVLRYVHQIWLRLSTMTGLLTNYNSYSWPIHMWNNSNKNRFHIWSVSHNTPIYSYFVLLHTSNNNNCHKCLCFRIMLCFTPGKLYAGDVLICSVNAKNIYHSGVVLCIFFPHSLRTHIYTLSACKNRLNSTRDKSMIREDVWLSNFYIYM